MSNLREKQLEIESKVKGIEAKLNDHEEQLQTKMDEKDVRVLIDEKIKENDIVTIKDLENIGKKMEAKLQESQIKLLKWMVATGFSSISAIFAIIRIFSS